jgi:hypothetical protein
MEVEMKIMNQNGIILIKNLMVLELLNSLIQEVQVDQDVN